MALMASVLLLVKLLLPRMVASALETALGVHVVRSHFRLLHMKFLRVELVSRRGGWGATVDEVALKVNSNFGSREGILQLTLHGVRLGKEEAAAAAGVQMGFDPGGGKPQTKRDLGKTATSMIAKLFRVIDKVLLHKAAAAIALEIRQAEYWAGESSSLITAKVISLAKIPSAQIVRLRCVDLRLRPRSWREESRSSSALQVRTLRCPILEVDLGCEAARSDKIALAAEVGGAVVDWAEYELGLAAFKLTKPAEDGAPWLAEGTDLFVAKEGVFSLDFGSMAFMQADGSKILSQLSRVCLHAKRRPALLHHNPTPAVTGASRFSLGLDSATLLMDGDSDGGTKVANVQLDKVFVRKKDVLAAEGEKTVLLVKKVSYDKDGGSSNAMMDVANVDSDLSSADISAMLDMFQRTKKYRSAASSPSKKSGAPFGMCLTVKGVDSKLNVGDKHRSVIRLSCDRIYAESKPRSAGDKKLKVFLNNCEARSELPLSIEIFEKIEVIKTTIVTKCDGLKSVQAVVHSPVRFHWHPDLHLPVWESAKQLAADVAKSKDGDGDEEPKKGPTLLDSISFITPQLTLSFHCDTTVARVDLSEMVIFASKSTLELYLKATSMSAGLKGPACPKSNVLTLTGLMASLTQETSEMRRGAGMTELQRQHNPCLNFSSDTCSVVLPFQVDLHRPMMVDVIGYYKWLKLIHLGEKRRTRRGQVSNSCLPDVLVYVRKVVFKVEDDLFEARLRDNYRLMEDEYNESQKRKECLRRKIEELRQSHSSFLSQAKVEELYSTLKKRDAELYTKRARSLCAKPVENVPALTEITVTNIKLFFLSDPSMESMDAAIKFMQVFLYTNFWKI